MSWFDIAEAELGQAKVPGAGAGATEGPWYDIAVTAAEA